MRTIKFRGLDRANEEWIYGGLIITNGDYHILEECITEAHNYNKVDKESVGQFTGLYDINGVEIYEGDIVVREKDKEHSDKYIVDHKQGMFVMCNYDYGDISVIALNCYIESDIHIKKYKSEEDRINCNKVLLKVIGNKYENK